MHWLQIPRYVWWVAALVILALCGTFYDGQDLWFILLLAVSLGLALLYLLLRALVSFEDWVVDAQWRAERFPWEKPVPTLFEKLMAGAEEVRLRMSELTRQWTRRTAPEVARATSVCEPVEHQKELLQPVLSPFGANDGMRRPGFLWTEKDEIE